MDLCFRCGRKIDGEPLFFDDNPHCESCYDAVKSRAGGMSFEFFGKPKAKPIEFATKLPKFSIGDKVMAHDDVIEKATGMGYDISGTGTLREFKDIGESTEQGLIEFPNWKGWIYIHEVYRAKPTKDAKMPDFPSDKAMLIDGIQAVMSAIGEDMTMAKRTELQSKSIKELEDLYDSINKKLIQDASEIKANKLLAELGMFIGTENWYKHPLSKLVYTDGVKYLATEASAYWLIDIVSSYFNKFREIPFQLWRIVVKEENGRSAVVTMQEDTGKPYLIEQEIPYTDFPLKDFSWYVIDGVMLLKSEY